MRKSVYFSALCIFSQLLINCTTSKTKETDLAQELKTDTLVIDSIHPLIDGHKAPACHFSLNLEYATSNEPSAHVLNDFIVSAGLGEVFYGMSPQNASKKYCEDYINDYIKENSQAASENYSPDDLAAAATWMSFEHSFSGKILYGHQDIVSYQTICQDFSGGAHGMVTISNYVFDLKNSQRIYLTDIFYDNAIPEISTMIQKQIMTDLGCSTLAEVAEKSCIFAPEEIPATDNFYMDEKGITWIYNAYEIACYAQGHIVVTLPWSAIIPMLRNDAPILEVAKSLANTKDYMAPSEINAN